MRQYLKLEHLGGSKVYIIQNSSTKNFKIGVSVDPYERTNSFQTGCDGVLELLGYWDGGLDEESKIHFLLNQFSLHGEWFRFCHESSQILDKLVGFPSFVKATPRPTVDTLNKYSAEVFKYLKKHTNVYRSELMENSRSFGMGKIRMKSCITDLSDQGLILIKKTATGRVLLSLASTEVAS